MVIVTPCCGGRVGCQLWRSHSSPPLCTDCHSWAGLHTLRAQLHSRRKPLNGIFCALFCLQGRVARRQHLGGRTTMMLTALSCRPQARDPPATELVKTTRFTWDLALTADRSTLAVPLSAGSMRSSCGLEVSIKKGDLYAVRHDCWVLIQMALIHPCWRTSRESGLRCVEDVCGSFNNSIERALLQHIRLRCSPCQIEFYC